MRFAVWAPNAHNVSVVGDFNGWDGRCHPMRLHHTGGLWELFIPGLAKGEHYKFEIKGPAGERQPLKADPCRFRDRGAAGDRLCDAWPPGFRLARWRMDHRPRHRRSPQEAGHDLRMPSWVLDARPAGQLSLAVLSRVGRSNSWPYVRDLGFTHIELLPITEFPFDGSWGYQPVSLFAPTSRFGPPEDFAYFVEAAA